MKKLLIFPIIISLVVPGVTSAETIVPIKAKILEEISIDQQWSYESFDVSKISVGEFEFYPATGHYPYLQTLVNEGLYPLIARKSFDSGSVTHYLSFLDLNKGKIIIYDLLANKSLLQYGDQTIVQDAVDVSKFYLFNVQSGTLETYIDWDDHRELYNVLSLQETICGNSHGGGGQCSIYTEDERWIVFINSLKLNVSDGQVIYFTHDGDVHLWLNNQGHVEQIARPAGDGQFRYLIRNAYSGDLETISIETPVEWRGTKILGLIDKGVYVQDLEVGRITRLGFIGEKYHFGRLNIPRLVGDDHVMWLGTEGDIYLAKFNAPFLAHTGISDVPLHRPFLVAGSPRIYQKLSDSSSSTDRRMIQYCRSEVYELLVGSYDHVLNLNAEVIFEKPTDCYAGKMGGHAFKIGSQTPVYKYDSFKKEFVWFCNEEDYIIQSKDPEFKWLYQIPEGSIDFPRPTECTSYSTA